MRGVRRAIALLVAGLSAARADQIEQVVVTSTRLPGEIRADDPRVTIIDAAEIAARHPSSVVELLRTLPGVMVQQAGGRGSVVSLFTRGAKPNFTLVMIDGVRVNDPTNTRGGSFDASTLALDDIERVEIVRGPASSIYGSDAVGGAINFITRRPAASRSIGLDAAAGMYGFKSVAAHLDGAVGDAALRLGASYVDNGVPVEGSLFHGATVDGALSAGLFDGATLFVDGRFSASNAQSFPDASGGPLLAVIRAVDHRRIDEGIVGAHARYGDGGAWSFALDYGLYDRSADAVSPGVAPSAQSPFGVPPNSDDVLFVRNALTATARYAAGASFEAAFGAELMDEYGIDDGTLDFGGFVLPTHFALDRTTWAGFGQFDYSPFAPLRLSAGLRYDKATGEDGRASPQLGAVYELAATGTRFSLAWAQAFKLPSFYALGNPIVGNPGLRPERAVHWDAGVTQSIAGTIWKLDLYDTRYRDLIDLRTSDLKLVNLSNVHAQGFELSADLRLADTLGFTPSLSYTEIRNQATGESLRDVPRWLASGVLSWTPAPSLTIDLTLLEVGSFVDNAILTGDVRLPGHQRVDLSATWRADEHVRFYASAENLLDARYQDAVGFPAPGIVVRTGAKFSL